MMSTKFPILAQWLLSQCTILCCSRPFRIVEIEFYLFSKDHPDPYVHRCPDQERRMTWYFHKTKKGNYRGGTFKGIDLTLGKPGEFFGILLRSIYDLKTRELITGPCRVVHKFLEVSESSSIQDLTKNWTSFDADCNDDLLLQWENSKQIPIYYGPRIGLSDKDPEYQDRKYRFSSINKKIKDCRSLTLFHL